MYVEMCAFRIVLQITFSSQERSYSTYGLIPREPKACVCWTARLGTISKYDVDTKTPVHLHWRTASVRTPTSSRSLSRFCCFGWSPCRHAGSCSWCSSWCYLDMPRSSSELYLKRWKYINCFIIVIIETTVFPRSVTICACPDWNILRSVPYLLKIKNVMSSCAVLLKILWILFLDCEL